VFILVVEDAPVIQDMVHGALSDGGFEAEMAASGEAAITLLQANKGKYRALITDVLLGGSPWGGKSPSAQGSSIRTSQWFT
jgi:DNA-binding response OmpR family regulator